MLKGHRLGQYYGSGSGWIRKILGGEKGSKFGVFVSYLQIAGFKSGSDFNDNAEFDENVVA